MSWFPPPPPPVAYNPPNTAIGLTGSSYMGKSTGKWALSVWTHHMKDIDDVNYSSSAYTGPALRLGAGVQVEEAYVAARARNAVVVGGDCETVGVVGGYLQGGGHSALSSIYGMAVDQVLEWEVVDGIGRVLTASPSQNPDMYWALSGGGGGTYGIVSSVIVKLLPDMPVTGAQLSFDLDPRRPSDFREAIRTYHRLVPDITMAGGMGIAQVTNDSFLLTPLTLPSGSQGDAEELLAPLLQLLESRDLAYSLNISEHANWLEYWETMIKPNPTQLVQNAQYGGWMVPRAVLNNEADALAAAIQEITDAGCVFVGLALNVSLAAGKKVNNSVLPAWREAALSVILSTPWTGRAGPSAMHQLARIMTERCVPALARLAPNAGAYLNEADPNQPEWQTAFYGENYDRLLQVKDKYDPEYVFHAHTAVGSDAYWVDDMGRLCRKRDPVSACNTEAVEATMPRP
ncbi:hypothetical protein G7054_g3948 [Neopestalotiopsis clavispora]|nr:hypothetical protein G7054_g3948 [Neopestalotiopsis clavispora]